MVEVYSPDEQPDPDGQQFDDFDLPLVTGRPEKMSLETWHELGEHLYGPDRDKWVFACPLCGNRQSVNQIMENQPYNIVTADGPKQHELNIGDVRAWINKECESTVNHAINCRWTRGSVQDYYGYLVLNTEEGKEKMAKSFKLADHTGETSIHV